MTLLFRYVLVLALVMWIGGLIFFSFIASPSIFKVLPRDEAGRVVSDIFPKYHLLGYACCAVALGCVLALRQWEATHAVGTAIVLLLLMGGMQVAMGTLIGPQVVQARDAAKAAPPGMEKERLEKKFRALHGSSMLVNLVVLTLGLFVLWWIASRLQI